MGKMKLAGTLILPSGFAGVLTGPGKREASNEARAEVAQLFPGAQQASRPLSYLDANSPSKLLLVLSTRGPIGS